MLEVYVEDNYYARFDAAITASEEGILMLDLTSIMLDDVKSKQSHFSMKSKSKALGHSVGLKSISRTITIQGLTLPAITISEKST